jgi:hypothetical protein
MPRVAPVDPMHELTIENFKIGPFPVCLFACCCAAAENLILRCFAQLTPGGSYEGVGVILPRPGSWHATEARLAR